MHRRNMHASVRSPRDDTRYGQGIRPVLHGEPTKSYFTRSRHTGPGSPDMSPYRVSEDTRQRRLPINKRVNPYTVTNGHHMDGLQTTNHRHTSNRTKQPAVNQHILPPNGIEFDTLPPTCTPFDERQAFVFETIGDDMTRSCDSNRNSALSERGVVSKYAMTYPPPSRSQTSRVSRSRSYAPLAQDNDLDMDVFVPMCVSTSCQTSTPNGVPMDFADSSPFSHTRRSIFPLTDKKDLNSQVYILHRYATDDQMLGDKFGINILTDDSGQTDGYYRHFCTKLISGSPADKMAIKNKDELVLVDGRFVPQLDHKELIQLFSRVPVDGVTKFELVLRRKVQKHSKTWEWFETSAILVPELNEEPLTKDTKVTRLHNNLVDKRTWQMYKVIGTEYFLTIGASGVGVDVLYNDNTKDKHKMVQKHAIICEDEHDNNKMDFLASLACVDERHFVSIDPINKAVVTVMEEAFFQYRSSGSDIFFKQKDMYLNCTNNTVVARETQQFFAEFPMPGHKDVVDDIDGGYVSTSPPKSLTLDMAPKRVTRSMSRQASLDTMFCGIDLNMKKI